MTSKKDISLIAQCLMMYNINNVCICGQSSIWGSCGGCKYDSNARDKRNRINSSIESILRMDFRTGLHGSSLEDLINRGYILEAKLSALEKLGLTNKQLIIFKKYMICKNNSSYQYRWYFDANINNIEELKEFLFPTVYSGNIRAISVSSIDYIDKDKIIWRYHNSINGTDFVIYQDDEEKQQVSENELLKIRIRELEEKNKSILDNLAIINERFGFTR